MQREREQVESRKRGREDKEDSDLKEKVNKLVKIEEERSKLTLHLIIF